MVLLGLLLAAVAIALGVGLALQPGDTANVHFFGLNIPNLNGRTLVLIGVAIGILFMLGLWFMRWGFSVSKRRRRERKANKAALAGAKREPDDARESDPRARQDVDPRETEREAAARRQEEISSWERAEAARREEAARQEEAALRARAESHQPDPYPPASPDAYAGHRPPEPYRGDNHPTDAYPSMDQRTEEYPTVDPYREEPRPSGTVYQSGGGGGHSYPDNDPYAGPQHRPY
ncbi:hypothetical protein [Cryptosporangium aurantiacum]|uniref:Lipopolysaccharide assembly protein A domain-containing protein n=1 Tax=Cryptosporangium aurantiacum TaxID=134849 RepID=A0A1M7NGN2_9ACTN|nr:hypothetical protein [Cryptosporangium aurantiacum]SHN02594.1 hypothetical protein SAMN05443668_102605 [Cryptosporangium aurantiacum]